MAKEKMPYKKWYEGEQEIDLGVMLSKNKTQNKKWYEYEQEVDLGVVLSENKAQMDSNYLLSATKLENTKDEYNKELRDAYGVSEMPKFVQKRLRPFREISDIVGIFDTKALKVVEQLQTGKIKIKAAKIKMQALLKQYSLRLEVYAELWIEAEKTRRICQETLTKQFDAEFNKAKKLLTERWGKHETFDNDRVDYLREAYLRRWYIQYRSEFFKLKPAKLKILKKHIKDGKFTSGNMSNDLKKAYVEMYKAIDLWKKEGSKSKSVYKKTRWDGFEVTFDRQYMNGEEERVGPLPNGAAFEVERKNDFPPGAKNLAASLKPKKKPTLLQKIKSKATNVVKSSRKIALAEYATLSSWARRTLKSGVSGSKERLESLAKQADKIRKKLAKETVDVKKKTKAALKVLNKLRKKGNYTKDVKDAYKASLEKADQLKAAATKKAKQAGVKAKEGYKKAAIELGKLKADAVAEMKNANTRAKIEQIQNKLENAVSAIAGKFGLSSKPGVELEKEATSKLGKTVHVKINYLKDQLRKKKGSASHKIAMLNSQYRTVYHKLQRATREYNSAMNKEDLKIRKAKLTKLNSEIDREAKANKITFPKSIFAGIATAVAVKPKFKAKSKAAPKPKPVAVPQADIEKVNVTEIGKFVDKKIKYLENLLKKKRGSFSHAQAMGGSPEYKEAYNKIQKAKKEYSDAMKEKDTAKKKERLLNLNREMNKQAKANKISFPVNLRVLPKAPKAQPHAGPQATVTKIEFKKAGQIDVLGSNLPEGTIKLNVSNLRADLITDMKRNSDYISKITFSRDNMNQKIAEAILNGIKDKKVRLAVAKKLKNKPDELIKILKLSEKPTIQIVGRASMDGLFSHNQKLAMRRAKNAKDQILKHNHGIESVVNFVTVGEVADVYGNKITNIDNAWDAFTAVYNLGFDGDLSITQMKAMVRKYVVSPGAIKDAQQRKFFKSRLDHVRGVQLHIVKPKKAPKQIAINMKNNKN